MRDAPSAAVAPLTTTRVHVSQLRKQTLGAQRVASAVGDVTERETSAGVAMGMLSSLRAQLSSAGRRGGAGVSKHDHAVRKRMRAGAKAVRGDRRRRGGGGAGGGDAAAGAGRGVIDRGALRGRARVRPADGRVSDVVGRQRKVLALFAAGGL